MQRRHILSGRHPRTVASASLSRIVPVWARPSDTECLFNIQMEFQTHVIKNQNLLDISWAHHQYMTTEDPAEADARSHGIDGDIRGSVFDD